MPAVRQLPAKLDLECIAGDPFTVTITATGVATLTSPAVTMTSAAGDAFTTDPGIPTASVAGLAVTSAWSTADTAALNTGTRAKSYRYSIAANPDSAGLFEIVAGTLTVHPVGHAGTSSASSATLAVTVGTTAVSLAVALGGGGGGGGATTLDDLTDVTITSATNGEVLKYNGTAWVNGTDNTGGGGGGGPSTLDDLTDVTITAAASGDILRHNGTAWVDAVGTTHFEAAGGIATHAAVTSSVHGISAFGATLVDDADAATARTTLGLAIGTNVQAYDAELAALAGLTSAADTLPYFTGSGTASTTSLTAAGRALIDDADATAQRATLGLVIGTNVQAQDAELAAIAGLTSAADRLPYFTGSGAAALATFTSAGRALVDDADATAQRATLGLVIGTNVQAFDQDLADIAGVTRTKGDLIVATSSAWTDLAVGTDGHVLTADSVQATGVKWAAATGASVDTVRYTSDAVFPPAPFTGGTSSATSSDRSQHFYLYPCFNPTTRVIAGIGTRVTTAEAGSTVRFGLYACNSDGTVGSRLADYSTVDTSSTGWKEASGSTSVAAGWFYVAAWISNHTAVRFNSFANPGTAFGMLPGCLGVKTSSGGSGPLASVNTGWRATGVDYSAGLPSTPPTLSILNEETESAATIFVGLKYS